MTSLQVMLVFLIFCHFCDKKGHLVKKLCDIFDDALFVIYVTSEKGHLVMVLNYYLTYSSEISIENLYSFLLKGKKLI